MELNWFGGHGKVDSIELYLGPTSGIVAVGISSHGEFVPILAFESQEAAARFAERLNELLEKNTKPASKTSEVPEVFRKSFETDESASSGKHF